MKISDIKIFNSSVLRTGQLLEVGTFLIDKKELKFKKNKALTDEEFKCDYGRVYLISKNNEIIKIGGSSAKGGIKGTISGYLSGKKGSPGESRFVLNSLMQNEINKKNTIKLHMILCPETYVKINGLTSKDNMVSVFAFKEIEKQCLEDYKSFNNNICPLWNFKERGESYPKKLRDDYAEYKKKNAQSKKN